MGFLRSEPVEGGPDFGRRGQTSDFILKSGMHVRHFAARTRGHGNGSVSLQRAIGGKGCFRRVPEYRWWGGRRASDVRGLPPLQDQSLKTQSGVAQPNAKVLRFAQDDKEVGE